ncbi:MAG: glycoside hydrolase domain-containing protein [Candidatus Brocadiia bacterium]
MGRMLTTVAALAVAAGGGVGARGGGLTAWAVDPHTKVFRDAPPPAAAGSVVLRAARNEFEPGQIAFRCPEPLEGVSVEVTPLRHAEGGGEIGGGGLAWNFVGFIPLEKNTRDSDRLQVRAAPCHVPDPLLEQRTLDVPAGVTQPVWLTVRVPEGAAPGTYEGEVAVVAGGQRAAVPVRLSVDPFVLPRERHLLVTNWFSTARIAKAHGVEAWSEAFWELLERYARHMAAHRQNVVYTPWTLIEVTREAEGKLSFDYGRFDRYIELFERAEAADRIEIRHVAHHGPGRWASTEFVFSKVPATDQATGKRVGLAPEEGLAWLLADLERHLARRGWLEKAMIHVGDEPALHNIASWRQASAFVRRAAPGLRRIDAIETLDFAGALEVWVPKLSHYHRWRQAYEARRADNEMWYYICCHPFGNHYPNRFLDYPLASVRVLHWINFAYQLDGYLHWGLNFWPDEPFGTPPDRLPPGDTHVIYPGSDGPIASLRWEIQRESIEDYEYLHLLAARTDDVKRRLGRPAAWVDPRRRALQFARRVVPDIASPEREPARIQAVRAQIADEIVAMGREPLLLFQLEPPAGSTLVHGPIVVELRGVVRPGTAVRANGRALEAGADGRFAARVRPRGEAQEVRIEAERAGQKKVAVRRFAILK